MKRYQIVKKIAGSDAQYISLHPYVNNDETYEFDTIKEAQNKAVSYTHLTLPTKRIV